MKLPVIAAVNEPLLHRAVPTSVSGTEALSVPDQRVARQTVPAQAPFFTAPDS